jgi:osmotically-inducible protein OsmY
MVNGPTWILAALVVIQAPFAACAHQTREQDDAISRAVKLSLYDHEPVNLLRIEVSTSRGVVYLGGEVDEYSHKETAERLSREVAGVVNVVNKVRVEQ